MNKKFDLCVIGLGYIGLPTAILSAAHGLKVLGVDIKSEIVKRVNEGKIHIVEPGLEALCEKVVGAGNLTASTETEVSPVYLIVVPTPFKENKIPDVSYVEKAVRSIIPILKPKDLVIIESTCPVGTTEKMMDLVLAIRSDLKNEILFAYCPERVLPGNVIHELVANDRVIGGINSESSERAAEYYSVFVKGDLHHTDVRTAEMCKLTENASRDVQIAFANELSIICDKAGVDVWELIRLANKHPRVNILRPGCGVGGHCIAVDPWFLVSDFPKETHLIAAARNLNLYKTEWCTDKIIESVRGYAEKFNRQPVIGLFGLTFKENINDIRESPAFEIAKNLHSRLKNTIIHLVDPHLDENSGYKLTDIPQACQDCDIIAILVKHTEFSSLKCNINAQVLNFVGP